MAEAHRIASCEQERHDSDKDPHILFHIVLLFGFVCGWVLSYCGFTVGENAPFYMITD